MSDTAPAPGSLVPTIVGVSIHGAAVLVDWDTVPGAAEYQVEVLGPDGHPLSPQPSMEPGGDGSSVVLTGPGISDGTSISVRVRSVSGYCEPMPIALTILYPPHAPTLSLDGGRLSATWSAVPEADAYEVEVLDADGLALHPQPALTVDGTTASIDAAGLANDALFGVRVRASAGFSTSAWSEAATVRISRVPPPAIVDVLYHEGRIDFAWSPIPGASRYLVQALDAGGERLVPQPNVTGFNHTAAVQGAGIGAGASVQLQVGVEVPGQGTSWGDPLPIDLVDLAQPQGVQVSVARDTITASWQPVEGATGYRIQVLDDAGAPVPDLAETDVDDTDAQVQAPTMRAGATYHVRIVPTAPHVEGPASDAVPFTRVVLPAPEGLGVVYRAADRRAWVRWQPVETAAAYVVRLLLDGEPVDGQPDVETTDTQVTVPAVLAPGTAYHVQVRAARRDADGEWAQTDFVATALPAPASLSLRGGPDGVDAAWVAVPGATGYELRVLDGDAEPLSPVPNISVDGTTARITGPAVSADATLEVRVRATAPGAAGPFGEPVFLRPGATPQPPAAVTATFHASSHTVKVAWAPVAGAAEYRVRMQDPAGQPVGGTVTSSDTRVVLDGSRLGTGDEYAATVSAVTAGGEGPASEPARFTVHEMGAPGGVSADVTPDGVRVRWQPAPDAAGYEVRLYDGEGMPLAPPPSVSVDGASALVPRGALVGRSYVEVRVRGTAAGTVGAWSLPLGVTVLTANPSANGASAPIADDEHDVVSDAPAVGAPSPASAEAPSSAEAAPSTDIPSSADTPSSAAESGDEAGSVDTASPAPAPSADAAQSADEQPRTMADASATAPSSPGFDQADVNAPIPPSAVEHDEEPASFGYPPEEDEPSAGEADATASTDVPPSTNGAEPAVPTTTVPGVLLPLEQPAPAAAPPAEEESHEAVG